MDLQRPSETLWGKSPSAMSALERFRQELHGDLILPGDAAYDEARRVWNGAIDKRPGAIAYCASPSRNCKVAGTEMASGAAVVANCWTQGQMMWNWDLDDPTAQSNPYRVRSDLWYRASFPDGRTGYLSEVYVVRGDRGGRGLPRCTP